MMPNSLLHNQSGQGVVEFILLAAIGLSIAVGTTHFLRDKQFAQNLISHPWVKLSGMIECGSWSGCGKGHHPDTEPRVRTYRPDQ